jgi:hypothetical protein
MMEVCTHAPLQRPPSTVDVSNRRISSRVSFQDHAPRFASRAAQHLMLEFIDVWKFHENPQINSRARSLHRHGYLCVLSVCAIRAW